MGYTKSHYKLGILGGMGPLATSQIYHRIIISENAESDQDHIEMVVLNKCMIPDRTKALLESGESPLPYLNEGIQELIALGCEYFIIPCNTAHAFKNQFENLDKIHFIDMIDEATKYIEDNCIEAYVLCTNGTKAVNIYKSKNLFYLDEIKQIQVMDIITNIKSGKDQYNILKELILSLNKPVLLACTELSIYYDDLIKDGIKAYDAVDILVKECISLCKGV